MIKSNENIQKIFLACLYGKFYIDVVYVNIEVNNI